MKEYRISNSKDKMRYHDFYGEGEPILFLHGLGSASSFDYPNVASQEYLLGNRRILIDLLGAGYSDKPVDFKYSVKGHAEYLLEFINHIGLEKYVLFGHSMGGAVALSLADLDRDRVSNIVLSEANLDNGGGFASRAIAAYEMDAFISEGFNKIITESRDSSDTNWSASLSVWLPEAVYLMSKSLVDGQTPSWREILYSLKCPKTFIYGENSLPDSDMQVLIDNNVHVEVVKNAGHSMAWENPEGLARAILNGLKRNA